MLRRVARRDILRRAVYRATKVSTNVRSNTRFPPAMASRVYAGGAAGGDRNHWGACSAAVARGAIGAGKQPAEQVYEQSEAVGIGNSQSRGGVREVSVG